MLVKCLSNACQMRVKCLSNLPEPPRMCWPWGGLGVEVLHREVGILLLADVAHSSAGWRINSWEPLLEGSTKHLIALVGTIQTCVFGENKVPLFISKLGTYHV